MTTEAAIELLPDSVTPPVWRAPVSWRTRRAIRIDVLMHRNFPLSVSVTGFVGLLSIAPFIIATMFLAKIDRRLAAAGQRVPLVDQRPSVAPNEQPGSNRLRGCRLALSLHGSRVEACPGQRGRLAALPAKRAHNDYNDPALAG